VYFFFSKGIFAQLNKWKW